MPFQIEYTLRIAPAVRQPLLYDLCGSTLSLIFDLSVPSTSEVIGPLLNVSAIGNTCPPLRAMTSSVSRGFACAKGDVLTKVDDGVPRCRKFYTSNQHFLFFIRSSLTIVLSDEFVDFFFSVLSRWLTCDRSILRTLPTGHLPIISSPVAVQAVPHRSVNLRCNPW
jgi:hypothetical protein